MTATDQQRLGKTLWAIADQLRGAMAADDFRDYMLAFLFLRYLSDNYEVAAKKELGSDYPAFPATDPRVPLAIWYAHNPGDVVDFEKQMRRKVHYIVKPDHLWANIANLAKNDSDELLETLKAGFDYIENESFDSTFQGLFSEINLYSEKLGKSQAAKNKTLCGVIKEIAKGLAEFSTDIDALGDAYALLLNVRKRVAGASCSRARTGEQDAPPTFGSIGKIYGQEKNITYSRRRPNNGVLSEETFWIVKKPGLVSKLSAQTTNPIKGTPKFSISLINNGINCA